MKKHSVTVYVKSVKTPVGTEKSGRWGFAVAQGIRGGGYRIQRDYKAYSEAKYESILPEDQKKVIEIVSETAPKYGFEVEIIDVAKESVLRKISRVGLKIKTFPTLMIDNGEKFEGNITKKQVESLLRKTS